MEIVAEQRLYKQVEACIVSIESDIDVFDFRFFNSYSQYSTLLIFVSFMFRMWFALFILKIPFIIDFG